MGLFSKILSFLPLACGVIQHVEQTIHGSASKKQKALDLTVAGLATLNAIDPAILAHAHAQEALAEMNDAIVKAANVIAKLQAAATPIDSANADTD